MRRAAEDDHDAGDGEPTRSASVAREVRFAVGGLVFGAIVLPLLVYAAGAATLGPYEGGLMPFLQKLYGDIAHGAPGAVVLVFGPYVLLQLLRITTRPFRRTRN